MNTQEIIKNFGPSGGNGLHFSAIREEYQRRARGGDYAGVEADYSRAKEILSAQLSPGAGSELEESEKQYEENWAYAAKYGFAAGLFSGFQQHFFPSKTAVNEMGVLLESGLFQDPGMERHQAFFAGNRTCREISAQLEKELPPEMQEHVASIDCCWGERVHFAAVYEYYIGYRTALYCIDHIAPSASYAMLRDTLLLEYEVGLIRDWNPSVSVEGASKT